MPSDSLPRASLSAIPRGVWALGFVSLLMDVSSEMIHSLLPVFLVSVLGASVSAVGLLEGLAEATASIMKVFSGVLSDWVGKRKQLVLLGYGLAALTKPLFALAPTVGWVVGARLADRVGKGIRGAPRDALLADLTPAKLRGASFGLRQTLDTVGAFAGPLLAIVTMSLTGGSFRTVFWVAVVPALGCVTVLVLFVVEPSTRRATAPRSPLRATAELGAAYWALVVVGALFTLARFSEAFLILKIAAVGLSASYVPLVLVLMNVAYAGCAYPAGWLSDRANRWWVVGVGAALLVAADLVLAASTRVGSALVGIVLWGLHMGFTQGLFAALVADAARPEQRGTAFGVFNLVSGVALLAASALAGVVWDRAGAAATFFTGAVLTVVAVLAALVLGAMGLLRRRAEP
jgi:MFS family permease